MKRVLTISSFLILMSVYGAWIPLPVDEKVKQSDFVGVVEIKEGSFEEGSWEAEIIESIKGSKIGEKIKISTYTIVEGDMVYSLAGADPDLEIKKRYLIYLRIVEDGSFQVVQSVFDALEIKSGLGGATVPDEAGNKRVYLKAKLDALRKIVSNQNKALEEISSSSASRNSSV